MLPTPHLRFVERKVYQPRELFPEEKYLAGTTLILQQWWHKPGWTKVGDPESGEWRDVPVVQEASERIAELEKILNSGDDVAVKINPDGTITTTDKAGETKMTVEDSEGKRNR